MFKIHFSGPTDDLSEKATPSKWYRTRTEHADRASFSVVSRHDGGYAELITMTDALSLL